MNHDVIQSKNNHDVDQSKYLGTLMCSGIGPTVIEADSERIACKYSCRERFVCRVSSSAHEVTSRYSAADTWSESLIKNFP